MISRCHAPLRILMPVKHSNRHTGEPEGNQGCGCSPFLASQET
ncbi:hypothetical protein C4K39_2662 [Pseudomonas sessilinigenes]|nr:hypothetical protein C4K39_2662 [Pseudomonas sessilinigenes]